MCVDVSNYGVPRVQNFSMVGGARIVVFVSMWIGAVCLSTRLWLLTFAFVVLPFRDR